MRKIIKKPLFLMFATFIVGSLLCVCDDGYSVQRQEANNQEVEMTPEVDSLVKELEKRNTKEDTGWVHPYFLED